MSRINWVVLNFPKLPRRPTEAPRTSPDLRGTNRTYTVTWFKCRIVPDMIHLDLASIWDWGYTD
ncbi:hypothetical protein DPMN_117832 [Dreissena polymorpha]|uniref:Uncharacterized protein n=1 Tax=Dreissena polymorpha TaxID=45954 RepID=A0A9D4JPN8_DREPO|nr:hypothetical protein DPMN_117832 [Dreissena polymorpha]